MLNNYSHIVYKPKVEKKTTNHYYHIKKQFGCAYLSHKDFLNRKDLSVIVMRNANNHIVGLTLTKKMLEEERKYVSYPTSPFPKRNKKIGFKQPYYPYSNGQALWGGHQAPRRIYIKPLSKWVERKYHVYQVIFTLVSEKFRGQGYNQILLDYVYNRAVKLKTCTKVIAHIRESNTPSLKSFQKNGYRVSKKWTRPYKNGEKKIRVYRSCEVRKKKSVDADTVEKINQIIKDYKSKKASEKRKEKVKKVKTKVVEKVKKVNSFLI